MVLYEPTEPKKNTYLRISDCENIINILENNGYTFRPNSLYLEQPPSKIEKKKYAKLFI